MQGVKLLLKRGTRIPERIRYQGDPTKARIGGHQVPTVIIKNGDVDLVDNRIVEVTVPWSKKVWLAEILEIRDLREKVLFRNPRLCIKCANLSGVVEEREKAHVKEFRYTRYFCPNCQTHWVLDGYGKRV